MTLLVYLGVIWIAVFLCAFVAVMNPRTNNRRSYALATVSGIGAASALIGFWLLVAWYSTQ